MKLAKKRQSIKRVNGRSTSFKSVYMMLTLVPCSVAFRCGSVGWYAGLMRTDGFDIETRSCDSVKFHTSSTYFNTLFRKGLCDTAFDGNLVMVVDASSCVLLGFGFTEVDCGLTVLVAV